MPRFALSLLLLGSFGCGAPDTALKPAPALPTAEAPAVVSAVSPKQQTLNFSLEQPGTIHPFEMTPVVAKLSGYITSISVDIGDAVSVGQVLAELSIPELAEEKKQKEALVALAQAEVVQAERAVEEAAARITSAEAGVAEVKAGLARLDADVERWDSELRRVEGLASGRVLDQQVRDESRNQAKSAKAVRAEGDAKVLTANALVREATARKARATADVDTAKAKLTVAQAEVRRLTEMLKYTQVRAPYTGVITARNVHTGHFLQANSGKPEALFHIARLETVRVFAEVPEASAALAGIGTPAVVRVPALKNREFEGTITRTARVLNGESRTLKIEIDLPNEKAELRPGAYATIRLAAKVPEALTVPTSAILYADETAYCFLVENGKAVKTRVQVGQTLGGIVEVLNRRRAGVTTDRWTPFTGGEKIVNGKLGELIDGQAVTEQ